MYVFIYLCKVSWWGVNITNTVEHFVWLQNLNNYDAAVKIAELGVEILIDLNGTVHVYVVCIIVCMYMYVYMNTCIGLYGYMTCILYTHICV